MRSRSLAVVAILLALLAGGLALPQASATQTWPRLELSADGQTWSTELSEPLFDSDFAWVPGCATTRTFYARNQSASRARLGLTLVVTGQDQPLRHPGLQLAVRTPGGAWHAEVAAEGAHRAGHVLLPRGAVVPVQVKARMLRRSPNASMEHQLQFRVEVRLTQRAPKGGARP